MNTTDKLYTEWAWRTKTGVPDINNSEDKAILVSLIKELTESEDPYSQLVSNIQKIKDDLDAVNYLNRYVNSRRFRAPFDEYTSKQNIDSGTLQDVDAPDIVFNILSKNGDLENYMNNLDKLPGFGSLGTTGNLIDKLDGVVSTQTVKELVNLGGQEGGRGVGRAEIGLSTLCKDVKMMKGEAGDLDWNGYLEVKGTGARLGKRDHAFSGGLKIVDLAKSKNIEDEKVGRTTLYNAPELLAQALVKSGVPRDMVANTLKQDLKPIYHSEALSEFITPSSVNDLNVALKQCYFSSYWKKEGVKHIIFVSTGGGNFGDYLSVNYEQGISYIKNNSNKFCSPIRFNQLAPQVFRSGVGVLSEEEE